jgi:transcriptional regulator with XRE-family HTH domain
MTTEGTRETRLREMGAEIRSLRTRQGMTSTALAKACGVSASLISQVERGLTAPSLDVLWGIARALGVPIGTFFGEGDSDAPTGPGAADSAEPSPATTAMVVRANQRKRLGLTPSLTFELLSPDLQRQIEFVRVEYGPGEQGPAQPFVHAGEEQLVVIEGEITMWIAGDEYRLAAGDSITFDCGQPHRVTNQANVPAVLIVAMTPPSF